MRSPEKSLAVLAVAAFCLFQLFVLVTRPLPETTSNFVDDTFYYLQIAQNFALHGSLTFDGFTLTNGFQPLWQLLLIPLYLPSPHSYVAVYYAVQVLQLLMFLLISFLIYRLAVRRGTSLAGLLAILLLLQYRYWIVALNGMEAALNLIFLLLLFESLAEDHAFIFDRGRIVRGKWVTGFILALAVLARLDSAYYVTAAGLMLLARWFFNGSGRRSSFIAAFAPLVLPPLALVGSYMIINKAAFGNYLPISGIIKSHFPKVELHPGFFVDYPCLTFLGLYGAFSVVRFLKNLLLGGYRNFHWKTESFTVAGVVFAAGYWLHAGWNALFMSWAVWDYYFIGVFVLMIPLAVDAVRVLDWISRRLKRPRLAAGGKYAMIALLLLFMMAGLGISYHFRAIPFKVRTMAAADWLRNNTPPEAVLAGTDCGILSYFSQRHTVNLDGLVNDFSYQEYLKRGEFDRYLKQKGVDYLAIFAVPDSLFYGTYQTYSFSVWSNLNRSHIGNLPLNRDWEVYRSKVDPNDFHPGTLIIVWQLPWSDQPLKADRQPQVQAGLH